MSADDRASPTSNVISGFDKDSARFKILDISSSRLFASSPRMANAGSENSTVGEASTGSISVVTARSNCRAISVSTRASPTISVRPSKRVFSTTVRSASYPRRVDSRDAASWMVSNASSNPDSTVCRETARRSTADTRSAPSKRRSTSPPDKASPLSSNSG